MSSNKIYASIKYESKDYAILKFGSSNGDEDPKFGLSQYDSTYSGRCVSLFRTKLPSPPS